VAEVLTKRLLINIEQLAKKYFSQKEKNSILKTNVLSIMSTLLNFLPINLFLDKKKW